MRRTVFLSALALVATAAACSGGDFGVAPGEQPIDDAAVDGNGSDATSETSPPPDTAVEPDAAVDAGGDAGDASEPDATPDGEPDACVKNECGGCAKLPGAVGGLCGEGCGGGKWICDGEDALKCDGVASANACGGCSALPNAPGTSCGVCGDGKWACNGTDAVKCEGASAKNACGGCTALSNAPGTACGVCGDGKWVCNGINAVKCDGAGALNACGGCAVLANPPGKTCGTCGTSTFKCSGTNATVCTLPDDRTDGNDLSTPLYPPSSWAGTTRVAELGARFKVKHAGPINKIWVGLSREAYECESVSSLPHHDPACSVCSKPAGSVTYTCSVPTASQLPGKVYLDLYAGELPAEGATPIATAHVAGDSPVLVTGVGKFVAFDVVGSKSFAIGETVSIVVRTDSTKYSFRALTDTLDPTAHPDRLLRMRGHASKSWTTFFSGEEFLSLIVQMRSCF